MNSNAARIGPLHLLVLALTALVVAGATWRLTAQPDGHTDTTSGSKTTSASPTVVQTAQQVSPSRAPEGGVVLPRGSDHVDGLPVGFPYTDLGAVSAQVSVARAQVGFDYSTALRAVRTYAAPADVATFAARARAAVAQRRQAAGVPADGPTPAPASYAATPVAYTLSELDSDYYAVTLLSYITLTTRGGQPRDGFYAGTQLLRWITDSSVNGQDVAEAGDWKLVEGADADIRQVLGAVRPRPTAPGTAQFRAEGWIQLSARLP